jgi:conjugal transfer mating pair stabilization protein TraN
MKSIILLLLIALNVLNAAFASSMNDAFNTREGYQGKTRLGNPDEASKFLDRNHDVSHLGGLNDASLMDRGKEALRTSDEGKLLQNSQERKIEAIERYKINPQNPWLKNSLAIEQNPFKAGGKAPTVSEKTSNIQVKKSCVEGVDFNVDVGIELVLECEEVEVDGPLQLKSIDIPFQDIPSHWWHREQYFGKGWDTTTRTIINNHDYLSQMQVLIAQRIAGNEIITVPAQDIFFHRRITDNPPRRNVVYPGDIHYGIQNIHVISHSILKFHYNSQEKLKKLVEKDEYWQVVTEGTEKLAESNECYEADRICLKSGVKTFFDKYGVNRPCWYEKVSYRCTSEPKGGCDHLFKQGCQLQGSACEYQIGSICLRWKRDLLCGGKRKELSYSLADSPIYCLGGDCHQPIIDENQDFANVAYLAALNEAHYNASQK